MEQMSREELLAYIQKLDSQYHVLNDRIMDIRDKQMVFLTEQIRAKNLISKIDKEAGFRCCPTCLARLPLGSKECVQCGEEL